MRIDVSCDGALVRVPRTPGGTAAWGFVIRYEDGREVSDFGVLPTSGSTSNNAAEYEAVCQALTRLLRDHDGKPRVITLRGDSQLWVNQLRGAWRARAGGRYFAGYLRARQLLRECRAVGLAVALTWVPRAQNKRADALCRKALRGVRKQARAARQQRVLARA